MLEKTNGISWLRFLGIYKGSNDKDVENQIKILAAEEISDRTPILDLNIK